MLDPINLHNPTEYAQFRDQRLACGWNHADSTLLDWRAMVDSGTKTLFWILEPTTSQRIGHISLDRRSSPPKMALADDEMTIATFFILPRYRSLGLGNATMSTLERWAKEEPYGSVACRAIVVDTLSRWYSEDEVGRETFRGYGFEPVPVGRSNEDWYVRRGYVKFHEQPTYGQTTRDGQDIKLIAVYLRKQL